GHDVGFAFDGDGDRVLAADRTGTVVDGDELIALAALHLRRCGRLSGDGIAAALLSLEALGDGDLAERGAMEKLPQVLVNVRVRDRSALQGATGVHERVAGEQAALEGRGRVLLRPSGTEPLVRVMVEA